MLEKEDLRHLQRLEERRNISLDLNFKGRLRREIKVPHDLELKIGDKYQFFRDVESWGSMDNYFTIQNDWDKYYYEFICDDLVGHEVDYDNDEECEILDCIDCFDEMEVLINSELNEMEIIEIFNFSDYHKQVILRRVN